MWNFMGKYGIENEIGKERIHGFSMGMRESCVIKEKHC
jgi:hypothetical protein